MEKQVKKLYFSVTKLEKELEKYDWEKEFVKGEIK